MSFFRRLFGGKDDDSGHEPPSMPWDQRPSILEFVRLRITTGKPGMSVGDCTLPDEELRARIEVSLGGGGDGRGGDTPRTQGRER